MRKAFRTVSIQPASHLPQRNPSILEEARRRCCAACKHHFGGEKGTECRALVSAGLTSETTKPSEDSAPCPLHNQLGAVPAHWLRELPQPWVELPALLPACSLTLGNSALPLPVLLCTAHNISLSESTEGGED